MVIEMKTENNKKLSRRKELLLLILLVFSLVVVVFGASLAVFSYLGKGQTYNSLKTGTLNFAYSDAVGGSNGIYIENAVPISDEEGKKLFGNREYFDFVITASTTSSPLSYEVIATKNSVSTLNDSDIKMYLTIINGSNEVETPITSNNGIISLYSDLHDTNSVDFSGKSIYFETIDPLVGSYSKRFRLRMWIDDREYDEDYLRGKTFSVRVNVAATN